ncbi:hypothetical protein COO60DRAFT_188824 [Scenedesmus sp. NREL 46B-D3]|nr:hypothetical protein COO60DRAFT_188824 [Scenedesmus sp. NREL 46B-D3]
MDTVWPGPSSLFMHLTRPAMAPWLLVQRLQIIQARIPISSSRHSASTGCSSHPGIQDCECLHTWSSAHRRPRLGNPADHVVHHLTPTSPLAQVAPCVKSSSTVTQQGSKARESRVAKPPCKAAHASNAGTTHVCTVSDSQRLHFLDAGCAHTLRQGAGQCSTDAGLLSSLSGLGATVSNVAHHIACPQAEQKSGSAQHHLCCCPPCNITTHSYVTCRAGRAPPPSFPKGRLIGHNLESPSSRIFTMWAASADFVTLINACKYSTTQQPSSTRSALDNSRLPSAASASRRCAPSLAQACPAPQLRVEGVCGPRAQGSHTLKGTGGSPSS